jgi:hypothetical protein
MKNTPEERAGNKNFLPKILCTTSIVALSVSTNALAEEAEEEQQTEITMAAAGAG